MREKKSARAYPASDVQHAVSSAVKNELETPINLRMATWSISSMTGKGSEVADVMRRRRINIMCVQETRSEGQNTREIGEGFKLYYTGSEKRNGVGIILDEELEKQVINVQRVSDPLMMAKIIVDTEVVNIVSAYAPQQGCNTLEKEELLEQLEDLEDQ